MTEFKVKQNWDGSAIKLGIAIPGFDGEKYPTSEKYWFDLTFEEAEELIKQLQEADY